MTGAGSLSPGSQPVTEIRSSLSLSTGDRVRPMSGGGHLPSSLTAPSGLSLPAWGRTFAYAGARHGCA